ncbi:unnamed protein product, partial [Rotaria magnacalcarata]
MVLINSDRENDSTSNEPILVEYKLDIHVHFGQKLLLENPESAPYLYYCQTSFK